MTRRARESYLSRTQVCAAALAGACAGFAAHAAPPAWFADAVAQLDAPSFAEREAAFERIVSERTLTGAHIETRLAEGGLSPEQRMRLDRAALERFAETPRAGLGVQFGVQTAEPGVPLRVVIDGFPAAQFLRADDVVLTIDGHPVNDTNDMGAIILSHEPGETLRMEIERVPVPGEAPGNALNGPVVPRRVMLDVPLGSFSDLQGAAPLSSDRLERAYRYYQDRVGVLGPAQSTEGVVGAAIPPIDWLGAEGYDHEQGIAPRGSFERIPAWRYVSFAGQPQSWIAPVDLRRGDPNTSLLRINRGLQRSGDYDETERALAAYRTLLYRVSEIDTQIDAMTGGGLARFDPDRAARLRTEREELSAELIQLAQELSRVP